MIRAKYISNKNGKAGFLRLNMWREPFGTLLSVDNAQRNKGAAKIQNIFLRIFLRLLNKRKNYYK
ncbi:MAG: hypothetical protein LBL13_03545 [Bacteroidales bacterium]|nr:hypothetical protein [Bacteroidales bacterium]